jgi:hypothetical protein
MAFQPASAFDGASSRRNELLQILVFEKDNAIQTVMSRPSAASSRPLIDPLSVRALRFPMDGPGSRLARVTLRDFLPRSVMLGSMSG